MLMNHPLIVLISQNVFCCRAEKQEGVQTSQIPKKLSDNYVIVLHSALIAEATCYRVIRYSSSFHTHNSGIYSQLLAFFITFLGCTPAACLQMTAGYGGTVNTLENRAALQKVDRKLMLFNKSKCKILLLSQNNLTLYQQAVDWLARKQLCWKRPGSPGGT